LSGPVDDEPAGASADGPAGAPDQDTALDAAPPLLDADGQPVLTLFGLGGRAVPALYLVGWIGSVMGGALLIVSLMGAGNAGARWMMLIGLVVAGVGLFAAVGSQSVERGRRPSLPYRGPSPVLTFLLAVVLTLLALVIVVAPLSALGVNPASPVGTLLSVTLTALVYAAVVRLLVVGPGAFTWGDLGLARLDTRALRDLAAGAALAIPVLVVTVGLQVVLARLIVPVPAILPAADGAGGLLLDLVAAVLIAPVGDELFFRGFVTTAWARTLGTNPAIIRGAVFFAFAHILTLLATEFGSGAATALAQFIALLPAGLALGWVFLSRRSLYAAIGLHAAVNLGLVLLANLTPG
jgi:membrane protease YdiL (CAAX protease family)